MSKTDNKKEVIDLGKVLKMMLTHKRLFIRNVIIAFILSCVWILPQPRTYSTEVTLAPEMESLASGGGLSSLASSFGFDMSNMQTTDAIYPMLYPDLINSRDFIVSLFDIQVTTDDGELTTNYYTYLKEHQKKNIYTWPIRWVKKQIKELTKSDDEEEDDDSKITAFRLTETQDKVVEAVRNHMSAVYDTKTSVITIGMEDQDPLICATMADSISQRLQRFITNYRTSKAKVDYEYYSKLTADAKAEYEQAGKRYAEYSDRHTATNLVGIQTEKEMLQNDYQQKFNTYNMMNTQKEAALAKVQERTPAFTIIENSSVPVKASKPKRMIFVALMMILTGIGTGVYLMYRDKNNIIVEL